MKHSIINILGVGVLTLLCLMSSSCSNEEESNTEVLQGDYTATLEISYLATGDASQLKPLIITVYEDDDQFSVDTLDFNAEWTKTVTYSTLPAIVGFDFETALSDDLSSGTEVSVGFKVSCTVMLLCGDAVVDSEVVEIDETTTFEMSDDVLNIIADDYLFSVTEEEITRFTFDDDSLIVDNEETEELPEEDQEEVKVNGSLYYVSSVSDAQDEDSLHDNIVARFASQSQWDGTTVLSRGDYLLVRGSETDALDKTVLKNCLDNGCILILQDVASFDTLESFCETYDIYCPLTEAPSDLEYCLFILADANADVKLNSSSDENVRSLFFMISPADDEDGYLTDYSQGLVVDNAVSVLNDLFEGSETDAASTRAVEKGDVTELVEVHKVLQSETHTLKSSRYQGAGKINSISDSQTNVYSVEYDIYNVYSLYEDLNYYYIHQEVCCNFEPCYKSVYKVKRQIELTERECLICEWYANEIRLTTVPKGTDGMWMHLNSPETTTDSSTEYTSAIDWTLSGDVGYSNGKSNVKIIDAVYVSEEASYSKNDVEVYNNCVQGTQLMWSYKFAAPYVFYTGSSTRIIEGAKAGRTTYTAGTDYIISFPEADAAPVLTGTLVVALASSGAYASKMSEYLAGKTGTTKTIDIELPMLHSSDFDDL